MSSEISSETLYPSPSTEAALASVIEPQWMGLPELVVRLAKQRGFNSPADLTQFANPKLSSLRDPFLLKDLDKAIDRLVRARELGESILCYGDFDLDGSGALAMLNEALQELGFRNFHLYQPRRLAEGYGLHPEVIERYHRDYGIRLVLTADVGITGFAAAKKADELGLDLIITDHHLPQGELPKAFALVNPNSGACTSGLGFLCGAGVIFYLLWGLRRKLVQERLVNEQVNPLNSILEYFVISTITDLVPLKDENRVLVKAGLRALEKTTKAGLSELLLKLGLRGRPLSAQDIAMRLAPKLNALSRMDGELLPLHVFLERDPVKAKAFVESIVTSNDMRVKLQQEAEKKALLMIKEWEPWGFSFLADESFHRGIIGLIASRVVEWTEKPCFVCAPAEDGAWVGSARLPDASPVNLVEALGAASDYLIRFGGHAGASGFEFKPENLERVQSSLKNYFISRSHSDEMLSAPENAFDLEIKLSDLTDGAVDWIYSLGPFGQGNDVPLFLSRSVQVVQKTILSGGHLKLKVKNLNELGVFEALLFSPKVLDLEIVHAGGALDLIFEVQWNYFRGRRSLQVLIRSMRPSVVQIAEKAINL